MLQYEDLKYKVQTADSFVSRARWKQKEQMKDKYLRDRRQHRQPRWHLQRFVKQLQFAFFKY